MKNNNLSINNYSFTNDEFRNKLREENKSAVGKLIRICCFCFTFSKYILIILLSDN